MKKLLFLLILPLLLLSCSHEQPKNTPFSKAGVSFTIPAGWDITEQHDLDSIGYYLSCEKKGINASGLFIATWINDSLDLSEMLNVYIKQLKQDKTLKAGDIAIGKPRPAAFSTYKGIGADYTASLLSLPFRGDLYTFHAPGKTVVIMTQEAVEDIAENKKGFTLLRQSFSCK